jgi:drug/metabolite transporter (DMT)-like permease
MPILGVFFTLLSAASFGLTSATIRRGMVSASALQGLYVTVFAGLPMFVVAALLFGELFRYREIGQFDYLLFGAAGVMNLLVGRYANYRAIASLGANRSGPVVGVSTLVSITFAVVFLDEVVTPLMAFGIALMMVGPGMVTSKSSGRQSDTTATEAPGHVPDESTAVAVATDPRLVEGIAWGLAAAVAWGLGPVLMRAAVDANGLGVLGGLVTYLVAAAGLSLALLLPGQRSSLASIDWSKGKWFLFTSVNSFSANLFRLLALTVAPVTIVTPLMRTQAIFALLLNYAINRRLESFEARVVGGILVSMTGAVLIVI